MASVSTTNLVGDEEAAGSDIIRLKTVSTSSSILADGADKLDGEDALSAIPFTPLLNSNQYTVRKMAAQAMMDVALMMANISQLRTLLSGGSQHISYFPFLMGLVAFSLTSQVAFGILIFVIWVRESTDNQREEFEKTIRDRLLGPVPGAEDAGKKPPPDAARVRELTRQSIARKQEHFECDLVTNRLNHVTMVLVFLITVTNMFITGFGIETPADWGSPPGNNT